MIRNTIQTVVQDACKELSITRVVSLEHPQDMSHGDFATSIALAAAKDLKQSPKELAENIAEKIREIHNEKIAEVTVAGPGFINIVLTQNALQEELSRVLESGEKYGQNSLHQGKKILVEHSSPNLFKPFHIGHLMNNTIGESMARIVRNTGADVYTLSFPSDVSLGIAKAIFILNEEIKKGKKTAEDIFEADLIDGIKYLGEKYVEGVKYFEEHPEDLEKAKQINRILNYVEEEPAFISQGEQILGIINIHGLVRKINELYFRDVLKKDLDSQIDEFVFESVAGDLGKIIVQENIGTVFKKSEGAIIYEPDIDRKDINTSVFINSDGIPTYGAKDLGLLWIKFNGLNRNNGGAGFIPDVSVSITDNEQIPHFKVVFSAAEKEIVIGEESRAHIAAMEISDPNNNWKGFVEKSKHVPHGRMTFKGVKMSSRLGGVPLAQGVIDLVREEAETKSLNRVSAETENDSTASMIAIAALKFSILKVAAGKPVNFDPEEALSFEGDSGPYIQYTYVRTRSLLEKASALGILPVVSQDFDLSPLERILYRFEEVALLSAQEYAPHHIVHYLLELAQTFNSWYGNTKVVDTDNVSVSAHRLAITQATGIILKRGLYLLGIDTPERM